MRDAGGRPQGLVLDPSRPDRNEPQSRGHANSEVLSTAALARAGAGRQTSTAFPDARARQVCEAALTSPTVTSAAPTRSARFCFTHAAAARLPASAAARSL